MESIPKKYFDRITKDQNPAAFLDARKDEELFSKEDTHLEFKAGAAWNHTLQKDANKKGTCPECEQDLPSAINKLKALYSRALGAFSNSGGGVLVWGMTAQGGKDPKTGIQKDRVWNPNLVQRPEEFKEKLHSWLLNATDPPLAGVVIEHYVCDEAKNEGYVVCYIPEGEQKPYRSEFDGPNYYYRYTGSSEVIMPPYLRQLFYPQYSASATLSVSRVEDEAVPPLGQFGRWTEFSILNTGRVSLRGLFIKINVLFGKVYLPDETVLQYTGIPTGAEHDVPAKFEEETLHPGMVTNFLVKLENVSWANYRVIVRVYSENNPVLGCYFHYPKNDPVPLRESLTVFDDTKIPDDFFKN